jgi:hypothetical protein
MRAAASWALVVFAACVASCADATPPPATPRAGGPDHPDSERATWKRDPALAACHAQVTPQDDLLAGVAALAQGCAAASHMHQVDQTVVGTTQAHATPFSVPLHVEAHHCYRAFGMSASSLLDLDVAFVDSLGKSAGSDGTEGSIAVALEDGEVCFSQADDAHVTVSSGNGLGKFAVEIWSD